jgi:hypothetical protein
MDLELFMHWLHLEPTYQLLLERDVQFEREGGRQLVEESLVVAAVPAAPKVLWWMGSNGCILWWMRSKCRK